jgi:hypothetical protein
MCLHVLKAACQNSKYRVVKTIRVPMQFLQQFTVEFPRMKIIHLIRDPRAMLKSQRQVGNVKWANLSESAQQHCNSVSFDIATAETFNRKQSHTALRVQYEDIAGMPLQTAKDMYNFLGAELLPAAERYIYNITSAGLQDNCVICTTRANSTEHMYEWRRHLDYSSVKIIDRQCQAVYDEVGYLAVSSETVLKDMRVSLRRRP